MSQSQYTIRHVSTDLSADLIESLKSHIRRLEIELDVAHGREKCLLDELFRVKTVHRMDINEPPMESVGPKSMSFKEAARRVKEFERKSLQIEELDNASEIESAISDDAGNSARSEAEGRGRAV